MSTGNSAAATRQIASELTDSYEIRHATSVDAKPSARISVSSNRSVHNSSANPRDALKVC
jgi:hypothetical protein